MLSQLRVLEKLSDGAAADLYLAQRHSTREQVVLEVLRPEHVQDAEVRERFMAEIALRKSWNHPHLARRLQTGESHNGRVYVVSEPLSGHTLRKVIGPDKPLSPQDFIRLMLPLCEAVSFLHDHHTAHGNLSPDSVFLPGGLAAFHPKLLDSGLSLLRVWSPGIADRILVRPEYLAPERIQGQRFNARSDIYSLGILMFEMLTGTPPFTDADIRTTRRRHLNDSAPPLPRELESFTPVLERCIAKDPSQRFESALALKDALGKLWKAAYASRTPAKATRAHAAEGKVMGSYELLRCIGEGAMGAVYEGRHIRLDRKVALKVLKPELSVNESFVDRFFQEAKAATRIRHEHIVEIQDYLDAPTDDGGPRYACVMELLEGQSLGQALRTAPLSLERILKIALQTTSALQAAHTSGVIHRDIKPDNIFLARKNGDVDFVKILDFGIAKIALDTDTGLTRNGEILGTPEYMAPEQLAGKTADVRSDIYSFASVLYRMLAGKPPFKGRTLGEQLSLLVNAPPKPLEDKTASGDALPADLRKLVLRCLDKNPDRRPQSMGELASLLQPFARLGQTGIAVAPPAPSWGEPEMEPAPLELDRPATPLPTVRSGPVPKTSRTPLPKPASLLETSELELARPTGRTRDVRQDLPDLRSQTGVLRASIRPPSQPPMKTTAPSTSSSSARTWVASAAAVLLVVAGASYRVFANVSGPSATEARLKDLSVTSVPTAVDVYDADTNELLGITPFRATFQNHSGAVKLRFERKGFSSVEKRVQLGEDASVHAVLPLKR